MRILYRGVEAGDWSATSESQSPEHWMNEAAQQWRRPKSYVPKSKDEVGIHKEGWVLQRRLEIVVFEEDLTVILSVKNQTVNLKN